MSKPKAPNQAASKVCCGCGLKIYLLIYWGLGYKVKNSPYMFSTPTSGGMLECPRCGLKTAESRGWEFKYDWAWSR